MKLFSSFDPTIAEKEFITDSLLLKLILLFLTIMLSGLLGTLLIQLFGTVSGFSLAELLQGLSPESSLKTRNQVRTAHLINQLTTFAIPALFVSWFFYRRQMWRALRLSPPPMLFLLLFGVLIIFISFPLTQFVYWINQQLPLPAWANSLESQANDSILALLVMESPTVLIFNLLVIAVLPAIGEELVFRGFLQAEIQKRYDRPILAIWITAFLFSAFHLQFAGFLPRLLLGALLGYLFYWSRSLWVPILAHFFFNGSQLVGHYVLGEEILVTDAKEDFNPNWLAAMISLILVIGLLHWLRKQSIENTRLEPEVGAVAEVGD